jgi:hypothetical protein
MELAQVSRVISRVCQASSSRKYKSELRHQGVLEKLIALAGEMDSMQSPSRDIGNLLIDVFRCHLHIFLLGSMLVLLLPSKFIH